MLNTKDQYVLENLYKQRDAATDEGEIAELNERIGALELLQDEDHVADDEREEDDDELEEE